MNALCALNPSSAGGLAMQRWPQIVDHLSAFRVNYELLAEKETPLGEQLRERLERSTTGEFDTIIGVGGDGTHSQLLNAMMQFSAGRADFKLPPSCIIPLGTGNNIAKSFGLTSREDFFVTDLRRAVGTVKYGADYHLDLGKIDGTYFADAFTIGLDSEILHDRNIKKGRIERIPVLREIVKGNYLLYTWALTSKFWKRRRRQVEIKIDGEHWYSGPIINMVINNTRIYGGEFDFSLNAYANDGLLDVIIFTGQVDYLSRYFLSLRRQPDRVLRMNDFLFKMSAQKQGARIEVQALEPEAAQIDGEELPPNRHFDISIIPNAIHIKTPAEP